MRLFGFIKENDSVEGSISIKDLIQEGGIESPYRKEVIDYLEKGKLCVPWMGCIEDANEHLKYISENNFDTLRGTKTYEMRIEKPSPDDLGTDAVVIRSFWAEFPSTSWPIIARVSTDGKLLHFRPEDNDGELNITTFDAKLNNDKSIDFNYFRYRLHVTNMGYEKGNGKATRL